MISPHHDSDLNPACIFHFPIDLERIVFEQAAYRDQKTALQLARVARRVCYWLVDGRSVMFSCERIPYDRGYDDAGSSRLYMNTYRRQKQRSF